MLSTKILTFYRHLTIPRLPQGINAMNPYQDPYTFSLCKQFYEKYYHDTRPRTLLLGINPGRFGSGTTGISFTDPSKLENECAIKNNLAKRTELSADFIYAMIHAFGGPQAFYDRYFISAVSPLGFTKQGRNINYYDDPRLERAVKPFIIESIHKLKGVGMLSNKCFCIGEGENFKFLQKLNEEHRWFGEIIPLPHPRFIMQYKRKQMGRYIEAYLLKLQERFEEFSPRKS